MTITQFGTFGTQSIWGYLDPDGKLWTSCCDNLTQATINIQAQVMDNPFTTTTDLTIDSRYINVLCDTTNNNIIITPPSPSNCPGRVFIIKKIDSSTHSVTFNATVDGNSSAILDTQWTMLRVISDGSIYQLMGAT